MNVQKWCEKKFLTTIFSPQTGLIDKQKAVLTTGPTNFRRIDRKSSLNAQCWNRKRTFSKKKILCKKSPWTRGKPFWQRCRLFSEKRLDFFAQGPQMINEANKGLSKRFSFVKLIPWTRKRQCRQLGRKKNRTKTDQFAINICNWWRKKIRQNFFHRKLI